MATLILWFGLIWAGWAFVFAAGENVLINTRGQSPIDWFDCIYFTAFTIFTLGTGDFVPNDGIWQIATALATASGMLFVTLSVSYLLSILSATVEKRSFASSIIGLAGRSEQFVQTGWDGEDFRDFNVRLDTLASDLSRLSKQHKAYPILHYYHSKQERNASAVAVAIFDESLTIIRFGISEDERPNEIFLETVFRFETTHERLQKSSNRHTQRTYGMLPRITTTYSYTSANSSS